MAMPASSGMGHADPEEVDAAQRVRREEIGVRADVGFGELALLAAVVDLAEAFVAAELGRGFGHGRVAIQGKPSLEKMVASYSSAPKLERMGTKAWKTCQLRMTHGLMTATKQMAARSGASAQAQHQPADLRRPRSAGQTIQRPQAGRKMSRELLERAMSPQSRPKRSQSVAVRDWSRTSNTVTSKPSRPCSRRRRASTRPRRRGMR